MNPTDLLKIDLTPGQITLNFLLAFALAFLWATVYRKTHSGVAYTRSFYLSIMLVAPTVAMIMMAIGSNVALSLGLVGSLSVIRFRTVIKDTRDMTFLFLSIGIGLCSGASAWLIGILGTALISGITVVMTRIGHDRVASADYILIFRSEQKEPWAHLPEEARNLVSWRQLRGATDVDAGREFEFTYNIKMAPKVTPERVVGEMSKNGAVRQVTMIAPENHLEL